MDICDHARDLHITVLPDGTKVYEGLRRTATREQLTDSVTVSAAALADVIRSKEAAKREKDRAMLPVLRQVLERSPLMEPADPGSSFE